MFKVILLLLPVLALSSSKLINVKNLDPRIKVQMKYYTQDNFVGEVIDGYKANVCLLSKEAAKALAIAQELALKSNLSLLVHDCYRPQSAVDHFIRWSKDSGNIKTKKTYYPHLDKAKLFELGYIAEKSGHSRGSTIDLTLFDLKSHTALDMGTVYDFLDPLSNTENPNISKEQLNNRRKLVSIMDKAGFKNYSKEWWHYTLRDEPFKD